MNTQFLTIRQTARELGISESYIRRKVKAREASGFYSGTRFYVDLEAFRARLDGICRMNDNGQAQAAQ